MTPKRIEVVEEVRWTDGAGSSPQRSGRARLARLKPIKPGRLEKDVDAVLRTKGLQLGQPLERLLGEFKRRGSKLKPFRRKRPGAAKRLR